MPTAVPYDEPSLVRLLVCASFFYLLNVVRVIADFCLYGGIVAEIILGIVYGSPVGAILPAEWEATFTTLGYVGLVLLIFEGGLSSNLPMLLSNLPLSTLCALMGIGLPIGFSIALLHAGFGYGILEAFAAGAALSSTSLGTTLAALNSVSGATSAIAKKGEQSTDASTAASGPESSSRSPSPAGEASVTSPPPAVSPSLQQTRIGTVLISAAIIDDVIGLVIAAIIPALASVQSASSQMSRGELAWTIVRPLLSSALIAAVAPIVARFILRPLFWYKGVGERWCALRRPDKPWGTWSFAGPAKGWGSESHADAVKVFIMAVSVSAMAAITYYTETSVLYGAYVAGLILTYVSKPPPALDGRQSAARRVLHDRRAKDLSFEETFGRLFGSVQNHILLPLFFASIGFAIPFVDLWRPAIIWRGVLYSILMCLAKLAVGLPVLLYEPLMVYVPAMLHKMRQCFISTGCKVQDALSDNARRIRSAVLRKTPGSSVPPPTVEPATSAGKSKTDSQEASPPPHADGSRAVSAGEPPRGAAAIHAAAFMGIAMVARGEIGLLIAQLARGGGDGGESSAGLLGEDAFLLCIWAILVCTLVGPMCLGFVVRRWGTKVSSGVWA
ncbi:hypothetical protein PYCCODRAFT_1391118 [Trametes coccinea BRFM310]|uniref:Cation/H+ exchanger transmembrane domain-containing protein n=1 Tax=Trametes coccinea (strain BRFM310) TaxID=1353009 RepID=A0A1Y2IN81_TRAC3|nr:hypothetical protein PYCCODRAFT_1391118 [Trametes coccinea BRFM310]